MMPLLPPEPMPRPDPAPAPPLESPSGEPMVDESGWLLPHYRTFAAIWNSYSKVYSYRYDEALRHLPTNALAMRRDTYLRALIQERVLPTAQLTWQLEPEDPTDARQKDVAERLQRILKRTPKQQRMSRYLMEAVWYGRYGSQLKWRQERVFGETRWVVAQHRPVNGDKIQMSWDGTPAVLINPSTSDDYPPELLVMNDRASPALKLSRQRDRDCFVVHTHEVDDADYWEGEMAGGVHGVGIRSYLYWSWWLRDELLSWCMDYMQKVGTLGLLVFWYEEGNAVAKKQAETNAAGSSRKNALAMPRQRSATGKEPNEVQLIPASTAGIEALQNMISQYFERHMERLVVGQSLSSSPDGGGLGGSSVADLHADTKFRILKYDANNLQETYTTDLVEPAKRMNFPDADFPVLWKFNVPEPENKDKLEAVGKAYEMGVDFKKDEVRALTGAAKPADGDDVISNQQGQQPGAPGQPGQGPPGAPGAGGQGVPGQPPPGQSPGMGMHPPALPPEKQAELMELYQRLGKVLGYAGTFVESDHPRDHGRFAPKGQGGAATSSEPTPPAPKTPYVHQPVAKKLLREHLTDLADEFHARAGRVVEAVRSGKLSADQGRALLARLGEAVGQSGHRAIAGRFARVKQAMASHLGEGVHGNRSFRSFHQTARESADLHRREAAKAASEVAGRLHDPAAAAEALAQGHKRLKGISNGNANAFGNRYGEAIKEGNERHMSGQGQYGDLSHTGRRMERFHAEQSLKKRTAMLQRLAEDSGTDWSALSDHDREAVASTLSQAPLDKALEVQGALDENHADDPHADSMMLKAWSGRQPAGHADIDPAKAEDSLVVDVGELSDRQKAMLSALPQARTFLGSNLRVVPLQTEGFSDAANRAVDGLGMGTLADGRGLETLFQGSKAPQQVAVEDVPDSAKGLGTKAVTGGGSEAKDPEEVPRFRRLSQDLYVRYEPEQARKYGSNFGYSLVKKADVPSLIGVRQEHLPYSDPDDAGDRLFEMLAEGNPEPMSEDDAYRQAFDLLSERAGRGEGEGNSPKGEGDDFFIPNEAGLELSELYRFDPNEPRDASGQWTAGGGGGGGSGGQPRTLRQARRGMHSAGLGLVARIGKKLYKGVRRLEHALATGMRATQRLAVQAAREAGRSEKHVERAARIMATADLALSFAASPAAVALVGVAGKAAGFAPTASLAYLAVSTAVNPKATLKAAWKLVKGTAEPLPGAAHHAYERPELAPYRLLLARLDRHDGSDWYQALVYAALGATGGDAVRAVALADEAVKTQPHDPTSGEGGEQYARPFDESQVRRGQPGNAGQFAPKGGAGRASPGGKSEPVTPNVGSDEARNAGKSSHSRARSRKPKATARGAGKVQQLSHAARRRRALHGLRNERQLSEAIGAHNLPDSEPADVLFMVLSTGEVVSDPAALRRQMRVHAAAVEAGQGHLIRARVHMIECKTFVVQRGEGRVRMSPKAKARKEAWAAKYGATFHTVVFDDRKGQHSSGNRLYYHTGVGAFKVSELQAAEGFDHLHNLILSGGKEGGRE